MYSIVEGNQEEGGERLVERNKEEVGECRVLFHITFTTWAEKYQALAYARRDHGIDCAVYVRHYHDYSI